jgi:UPF0716 protein FxsA
VAGLVVLTILLLPVAEVLASLDLADRLGWDRTVALAVASLVAGLLLVRVQRPWIEARLRSATSPAELAAAGFDGACLAVASILLWFPGLVSDVLAVPLLLPPTRFLLRRAIGARLRAGAAGNSFAGTWTFRTGGQGWPTATPRGPIIEAEAEEIDPATGRPIPPQAPRLGPAPSRREPED